MLSLIELSFILSVLLISLEKAFSYLLIVLYSGLQNDRQVFLEIVHRAEIEPHLAICTAFFLSHEKYFSNPKQEFTK